MGNSKYFVALFLSFLVEAQCQQFSHSSGQKEEKSVLASVREYPLFIHKCTATFLTPRLLLTTASCLLCAGNCSLHVRVFSNHLISYEHSMGKNYPVESTAYLPSYEQTPELNDVGLIKLKESVMGATVFGLPDVQFRPNDNNGNVYFWNFNKDLTDFVLRNKSIKAISNDLCSMYLHRYISYKQVCILSDDYISLGPFDYGSPIIVHSGGEYFILGTFVDSGIIRDARIVVYQSINPHIPWITKVMQESKKNPGAPLPGAKEFFVPTSAPPHIDVGKKDTSTFHPSFAQPSATQHPLKALRPIHVPSTAITGQENHPSTYAHFAHPSPTTTGGLFSPSFAPQHSTGAPQNPAYYNPSFQPEAPSRYLPFQQPFAPAQRAQ